MRPVIGRELVAWRVDSGAGRDCDGAARAKAAAGRRIGRIRQVASEDGPAALGFEIGIGHCTADISALV